MGTKKIFLIVAAILLAYGAKAQTNLQVFYDFGSDRKHITTTLEMFKTDKWGSTFFFVDYDYANGDKWKKQKHGAKGSYFEIARALNFWQDTKIAPLSLHVELNSGVGFGSYNWLFGVEYFLHSADFKNTLTLELLGKTFKGSDSDLPMQFTAVWGMDEFLGIKGVRFSGFADIWGENVINFNENLSKTRKFVFLSEPQLWYNIGKDLGCENLHIGTEIELSCNFAGFDGFKVNPCLGAKWIF